MSTIQRDRWVDVLVEQRAAQARLRAVRDQLTPADRDIAGELLTLLGTNSKFCWRTRVKQLVEMIGYSRQTISAALNKLTRLGVLAWQCGLAGGRSFVALAQKYLPGTAVEDEEAPAEDHVKPALTAGDKLRFTPVREEQDEKNVREREPESAPSLPALSCDSDIRSNDPSPNDDGSLSPEEIHDMDARFAAGRLAMHLFNGTPDKWTCETMYRRFRKVAIGATTQVLQAALLGRPSSTVDCPHAYAVAWIATAERKVMHRLAA